MALRIPCKIEYVPAYGCLARTRHGSTGRMSSAPAAIILLQNLESPFEVTNSEDLVECPPHDRKKPGALFRDGASGFGRNG